MDSINDLLNNGEFNNALVKIEDGLLQDPYNIDLLTLKAQVFHKQKQYSDAIRVYSSLINLVPRDAENYANRALTYHALEEHNLSLADFTKAIELEPENGYRYSSRAFIKDFLGDHLSAMADYNKAIELDPEDAVSFNNRGLIEEKLGRMHLAQESFSSADKLAGVDNQSYNLRTPPEKDNRKNKPVDFKYFISILKSLGSSAGERKKFFDFLFNRK